MVVRKDLCLEVRPKLDAREVYALKKPENPYQSLQLVSFCLSYDEQLLQEQGQSWFYQFHQQSSLKESESF